MKLFLTAALSFAVSFIISFLLTRHIRSSRREYFRRGYSEGWNALAAHLREQGILPVSEEEVK